MSYLLTFHVQVCRLVILALRWNVSLKPCSQQVYIEGKQLGSMMLSIRTPGLLTFKVYCCLTSASNQSKARKPHITVL